MNVKVTHQAWPTLALLPQRGLMLLVRGYRFWLKPWLGQACRFEPTCSAYALQALHEHGAARGAALTGWRLLRCQPWCDGGCDPVPAVSGASGSSAALAACTVSVATAPGSTPYANTPSVCMPTDFTPSASTAPRPQSKSTSAANQPSSSNNRARGLFTQWSPADKTQPPG